MSNTTRISGRWPESIKGIKWGKGQPRQRTSESYWKQPLLWNRQAAPVAENHPLYPVRRPRVFCASLADWLDDEVPVRWLRDLLLLIETTPNLDWLLLTKRPENWEQRIWAVLNAGIPWKSDGMSIIQSWIDFKIAPFNVWLGTSVEDQIRADLRIPLLLKIPAKVRFLSAEPLLGPVDLAYSCFNGADSMGAMPGLHWVIFGGESGPKSRPCGIDWIRAGVKQCRAAGVAPFVKQLGAVPVLPFDASEMIPSFKDRKGGDIDEWPADLRVREWPV
jgi:protein gp37